MTRRILFPALWPFLLVAASALGDQGDRPQPPYPPLLEGRYRLVEGSTLTVDRNLPVPPVILPLRGRMWVHSRVPDPCCRLWGIKGMEFHTLGGAPPYLGAGRGEYHLCCAGPAPPDAVQPVEPLGEMRLWVSVSSPEGVQEVQAVLHGGPVPVGESLPWVVMDLVQVWPEPTPGEISFGMRLVAAPWPEVWFSTEIGFTPSPRGPTARSVSDGDLLSALGRVVRTNRELTARLGIMPVVPDLGLDAVLLPAGPSSVAAGEIHFAMELSAFSETLGPLGHGDLLSDAGRIVRSNAELLAAFRPTVQSVEIGLDGASSGPSELLYFSTEEDFFSGALERLVHHGDLLLDSGAVVKTNANLLARFHPTPEPVDRDLGLDALHVWSHGEVWFSTEVAFEDHVFGRIRHGDLLSDKGWVVVRHPQLMGPFSPLEDVDDFGLDALSPQPATTFAGCGTLVRAPEGCVLFEDTGGSRYLLENRDGFGPGDHVWVAGIVERSCVSVCFAPCIRDNAIESCVLDACGVLHQFGSCLLFQADGEWQLYALDDYGGFGAGDRVRVTGIRSSYCSPPPGCEVIPVSFSGCIEANTIGPCTVPPCDPPEGLFVRADADLDGEFTLNDAVVILRWLFMGGRAPCKPELPEECCCFDIYDVDDQGSIELTDGVYLLRYLFVGGRPPPPPFPGCGTDPSDDELECRGRWCPVASPVNPEG